MFLSGCERSKTEFDREVDRLCAVDGGLHVYETVELPPEYFLPDGTLDRKFSQSLMLGKNDLYRTKLSSEIIEERRQIAFFRTRVVLSRSVLSIVRVPDEKLIAESVGYARGGGDFFGPWADSSYVCLGDVGDPVTRVFQMGVIK